MRKAVLVSFFILINILIACTVKCPSASMFFRINAIELFNYERYEGSLVSQSRSLHEVDTVGQQDFYVLARCLANYYGQNTDVSGASLMARNDCELDHGYNGTKEGLKNIHVISLNNFNASYQANDTITTACVFGMTNKNNFDFKDFLSKEDFVMQYQNSIDDEQFRFKVNAEIENNYQEVSFKLVLELTNGDVFEAETEAIVLSKYRTNT